MIELKQCPKCGRRPLLGYACGEYFIVGQVEGCGVCDTFGEMHASIEQEAEAWNRRADRGALMQFPIRRDHHDRKNGNDHLINGIEVEVVRCRACKHHYWEQEPCHGKSVHYCKIPHMRGVEVFKEFFCYYGERKEGAYNG